MKHFMALLLLLLVPVAEVTAQYYSRRTNLPAIVIDTYGKVPVNSKTVYVQSTLTYVDEDDVVTTYDSTEIRGRGNSTWNMSKKPYKLKFHEKQKLLGKGYAKAKKWTLLANAGDKTMMRNALTSAMGEMTSLKFNPAYKFVDLVLNVSYQGTYQLSDQVEVRAHRVDITEQDYPLTAASDITGGYLLEVDGFRDGNNFVTSRYQVPIRIHYPDDEEIAEAQNAYIRDYMRQFEAVLSSNQFDDPTRGYRPWVDSLSLADWYICTEVSANIDGFYSTYFYKEQQDARLYWGPLWDYDIAYNNDWRMQSEKGLSTTAHSLMTDIGYGQTKMWINRMWEDPWFARLINRRYQELLDAGLQERLYATIDSLTTLLSESQRLNYQKWGIDSRAYHEQVLYSSFAQYVSDLRNFIAEHCAWLSEAFNQKRPPEPTPPFAPLDYYYHVVNVNTGKAMELSGGKASQYTQDANRESEDWCVHPTSSGHFQFINRATGMALNDPTTGAVTPTTNVGAQLNSVAPNENDSRQLWDLLPQGTEGYYNLLNVYTQHIANLSGGNSANGTAILSYTNDARNASSFNRLWYLIRTATPLPGEYTTAVGGPEPEDYALAYNRDTQTLHFGSATPQALSFMVAVHTAGGRLVGRFHAAEAFSTASLPSGLYIVTWTVGGQRRSAKWSK